MFRSNLWPVCLAAILCLFALPGSRLAAQTPSIDIYYPNGHARAGGGGERPVALKSPLYQLQHELRRGKFDLLHLLAGPQPGVNLFAPGAGGGITFQVTDSTGKLFSPVYADGNAVVGTHNGVNVYDSQLRIHDGGEHYYSADIVRLRFRAADNTLLPLEAVLNLFVWGDRVFFDVAFNATGSISLQKLEIVTAFADGVFDRYQPAGGAQQVINAGSLIADPIVGGFALSSSLPNPAGALAYIVGAPAGTKHLFLSRGTYSLQAAPALVCRQVLHDSTLDGGLLNLSNGAVRKAYFQLDFSGQSNGTLAIKVINHYGDEVLKVFEISS